MKVIEAPVVVPVDWGLEVADLEVHGVQFSPEQLAMYAEARTRPVMAMRVDFPIDPYQRYPGWGSAGQHDFTEAPVFTLDRDGLTGLVTCPRLVELDWTHECDVLWHEGPQPFPWVPGRALVAETDDGFETDVGLGPPEAFRLWNLWPVCDDEAEDVLESSQQWQTQVWDEYEAFVACEAAAADPCMSAITFDGITFDLHDHREHYDRGGDVVLVECANGERWMENYRRDHYRLDDDGLPALLSLEKATMFDQSFQSVWECLRDTSEANSYRALTAIPKRFREGFLRRERLYSPWLWLC